MSYLLPLLRVLHLDPSILLQVLPFLGFALSYLSLGACIRQLNGSCCHNAGSAHSSKGGSSDSALLFGNSGCEIIRASGRAPRTRFRSLNGLVRVFPRLVVVLPSVSSTDLTSVGCPCIFESQCAEGWESVSIFAQEISVDPLGYFGTSPFVPFPLPLPFFSVSRSARVCAPWHPTGWAIGSGRTKKGIHKKGIHENVKFPHF